MPALTKAQIIDSICERLQHFGHSRNQCSDMVETMMELIKRSLENGEDVMISNFGKFCVKKKNQRKGRNPSTGDAMLLRERRVVTFKCAGKLRKKLNGQPTEWWEKNN